MRTDVYIIKRNTFESKNLSRLGFDRKRLSVVETRNGWPSAWRIQGEGYVEGLCLGIVELVEKKDKCERTSLEHTALYRAMRVLNAINNKRIKADKKQKAIEATERKREESIRRREGKDEAAFLKYEQNMEMLAEKLKFRVPTIRKFLSHLFPVASKDDIDTILEEIKVEHVNSYEEILDTAARLLPDKISAWRNARTSFVRLILDASTS